jgi:hypothetical protein
VMLLLVDLVNFRFQYMKLYFLFYFKVVLDDPFVESNTCLLVVYGHYACIFVNMLDMYLAQLEYICWLFISFA